MATPAYTNDDHLDIAYMLVFNYISLQERVRLRIICNRWKNVIEADCAQMTTLRVFGEASDKSKYIWRSKHQPIKSATAELKPEEELNRNANPWNTITLKRPEQNQTDLSFLTRLFPAVQNLALTWDGIIDGLLRFWAPNLRELYLVTPSYKAEEIDPASDVEISLDAQQIRPFWQCLALMAPSLQKLALGGLRGDYLSDAPESLVLSSLEEFTHYNVKDSDYDKLMSNTGRLSKLAPVLQSFRLPTVTDLGYSQDVWKWDVPATVSRLAFYLEEIPYPANYTICPSVTHLELQFGEYYYTYGAEVLPDLIKKFPNTKSLAIIKGHDFPRWLTEKGEEFESADFLAALTRRPPGPFDGIEELYLGSVTTYVFVYRWRKPYHDARYKEKKPNYDLIFRGIGATFKGLKKLTLAMAPDTERKHRAWHKKFVNFKNQYMPEVEMAFVPEIDVNKSGHAFKEEYDFAKSTAEQCFLAPGCIFGPQPDKPQVKKRATKKPAAEKPAAEKPAAKKPAAKKPAAKKGAKKPEAKKANKKQRTK